MPSTKKRASTKVQKDQYSQIMLDAKRKHALELKKLQRDLENEMESVLNKIDMDMLKLPAQILKMTFSEFDAILNSKDSEDEKEEESFTPPRQAQMDSNLSDNGYATDKSNNVVSSSVKSTVMTSTMKNKLKIQPKSVIKSKKHLNVEKNMYMHTPKDKKPQALVPITPKVDLNTPVNILRQPRRGETIISMTGSPILATKILQEERMANLMLPLDNGDVISVLPTGDLRQSLLPSISPTIMNQLKTLKNHIDKFISDRC